MRLPTIRSIRASSQSPSDPRGVGRRTWIVWRGLIFWYSVGEPADDLDQVRRADVELELVAHPQPGEVEQLVDQSDQLGGALVDDLEALGDLAGAVAIRSRASAAGAGWRCP